MKKYEERANNNQINFIEFESISEMVRYNFETQAAPLFRVQYSYKGDAGFTGTRSYKEASEMLLNGWSDGAVKLTKQLKIANQKPVAVEVKRAVNDIVGFQVNVPRYLQGIPNNMINKRSVKQKQKVMTLTKSIAYSARVSASDIFKDSVKFLQIAQAIEKKNIRVNLNIIWHVAVDNEEFVMKLKIKSANERINLSKLSFPLIHPSMLRRIAFCALEKEKRISKPRWSIGYGRPQNGHTTKLLVERNGNNEIFIPVLIKESQALDIVNSIN